MDNHKLTSNYYASGTDIALGSPWELVPSMDLKADGKVAFISEICWAVVIWIVKYSILAFYWRLFSANRQSTRAFIWVLAALVTCWGVAVVRFSQDSIHRI